MPGTGPRWVPLATKFPSTLDSETDTTRLPDGASPDAIGLGLDYPGSLYASAAVPSGGSTPIAKTGSLTDIDGTTSTGWTWYYRRYWKASSANLLYNSPEHQTKVQRQGLGAVSFDEDSQSLVTFFPFAGNAMFVAKSTGGYMIDRADSLNGDFQHGNIVPAMKVATAGHAVELNQVAYATNAGGLFAWDGQQTVELSRNARTNLSSFTGQALTVDYNKGRVIGTTFAWDATQKVLAIYDGATFRWTSPAITEPSERAAFGVVSVAFEYENASGDNATMAVQVRGDRPDWYAAQNVTFQPSGDERRHYILPLETRFSSRRFQLRLTGMSTNLKIQGIWLEINATKWKEASSSG